MQEKTLFHLKVFLPPTHHTGPAKFLKYANRALRCASWRDVLAVQPKWNESFHQLASIQVAQGLLNCISQIVSSNKRKSNLSCCDKKCNFKNWSLISNQINTKARLLLHPSHPQWAVPSLTPKTSLSRAHYFRTRNCQTRSSSAKRFMKMMSHCLKMKTMNHLVMKELNCLKLPRTASTILVAFNQNPRVLRKTTAILQSRIRLLKLAFSSIIAQACPAG